MHYPANLFSKNGKPTIVPTKPLEKNVVLGQRTHLSKGDIAALNFLYPKRSSNHGSDGKPSVEFQAKALKVFVEQKFNIEVFIEDDDTKLIQFKEQMKSSNNNVVPEQTLTIRRYKNGKIFLSGQAISDGSATITLTVYDKNGYSTDAKLTIEVGYSLTSGIDDDRSSAEASIAG